MTTNINDLATTNNLPGRQVMTPTQAKAARALARYFGHEWGGVEQTEGLLDVEEIRATTAAARTEPEWGGIDAPTMVGDRVVHRTASGRVEWAIGRDGLEEVIILRPIPRTARDLCVVLEDRLEELVPYRTLRPESIRGRQWKAVRDAISDLEQALLPLESIVCLRWTRWGLYQLERGEAPAHERHWQALLQVLRETVTLGEIPRRPDWLLPDESENVPTQE